MFINVLAQTKKTHPPDAPGVDAGMFESFREITTTTISKSKAIRSLTLGADAMAGMGPVGERLVWGIWEWSPAGELCWDF